MTLVHGRRFHAKHPCERLRGGTKVNLDQCERRVFVNGCAGVVISFVGNDQIQLGLNLGAVSHDCTFFLLSSRCIVAPGDSLELSGTIWQLEISSPGAV